MEQQLNINLKRLWELAKQGKSAEEIMTELGISDMAVLQSNLQNLMRQKGETINIPGLIDTGADDPRYTAGGERVPPEMSKDRPEK